MRSKVFVWVTSYERPGRVVPPTARQLRGRSVILQRGERMDWHSTGAREELLIIVGGCVVLELKQAQGRQRRLAAGQCAFIPTQTIHRVVNRSHILAHYLYVTAPSRVGTFLLSERLRERRRNVPYDVTAMGS